MSLWENRVGSPERREPGTKVARDQRLRNPAEGSGDYNTAMVSRCMNWDHKGCVNVADHRLTH